MSCDTRSVLSCFEPHDVWFLSFRWCVKRVCVCVSVRVCVSCQAGSICITVCVGYWTNCIAAKYQTVLLVILLILRVALLLLPASPHSIIILLILLITHLRLLLFPLLPPRHFFFLILVLVILSFLFTLLCVFVSLPPPLFYPHPFSLLLLAVLLLLVLWTLTWTPFSNQLSIPNNAFLLSVLPTFSWINKADVQVSVDSELVQLFLASISDANWSGWRMRVVKWDGLWVCSVRRSVESELCGELVKGIGRSQHSGLGSVNWAVLLVSRGRW